MDKNSIKYKPLTDAAKKETTAVKKCNWIVAILELIVGNDLHHLSIVQQQLIKEVRKRTNGILVLLVFVLLMVLVTNPQVGKAFGSLVKIIF